ncbi:TIGR03364 family FAD-dependent oxidoreductase [Caulobacter mirabilis]|uniref:TIGR03364 family FAD-dependent oxidoreductase n=1 Tax=Caulobacter mirabilis TaxID=69666 RepID=A0A2D2B0W1_9CAUL|nr:TIGR03364 family FAD-dependent oxidoreductase [Caulobacter mirabilis]ATQ43891.1 TIGR03364 family FAD-dependent oxidoreductase [Caulobacter mirabilis]
MEQQFDLAVVGAGVVGLAHALAAARLGKRVVVADRDAQANGASVRNFGFVTVTGQARGEVWRRARRSAAVWGEIAGPAGIDVLQRGLTMVARRPEAKAVLQAFLETEMAEGCAWRDADGLSDRLPGGGEILGGLTSAVDLRVESRTAIPRLAAWLQAVHGVTFLRGVAVRGVETGRLETTAGPIRADAIVVCPGDDLVTLFPDHFTRAQVTRCKLQMMRLGDPGWRLPAPVMSDLGLVRYLGYAELPEARALRARLEAEQPAHLEHGVHLIVVQSADGSLVVGDSHHYAATPDPFARDDVDALILDEFAAVFGQAPPPVLERWTGTYASASGPSLVETPLPGVRLVTVTSGTGASTGFGLAEEVIADLYDLSQGAAA